MSNDLAQKDWPDNPFPVEGPGHFDRHMAVWMLIHHETKVNFWFANEETIHLPYSFQVLWTYVSDTITHPSGMRNTVGFMHKTGTNYPSICTINLDGLRQGVETILGIGFHLIDPLLPEIDYISTASRDYLLKVFRKGRPAPCLDETVPKGENLPRNLKACDD